MQKLMEAVNRFVAELDGVEGIDLPKCEVLPAETAERITALQSEVNSARQAVEAAKAETAKVQLKVNAFEAQKADGERRVKAGEALAEALKDEKFSNCREAMTAAAPLDDKSFTAESVAKFVEKQIAIFDKLTKATKPVTGVVGKDIRDEDLDRLEAENLGEQGADAIKRYGRGRTQPT